MAAASGVKKSNAYTAFKLSDEEGKESSEKKTSVHATQTFV